MKKIGIVLLSLIFGVSLFVGQSFARGENQRETTGSTSQQSGITGQQSEQQFGMQSQQTSQAGDINRASELIGSKVRNQQGEDLGELKDIVFDSQGNVSYIVLSKRGIFGMGGEVTPIPWQAANPEVQEDSLVLDMEKQRVENAPSFAENDWNDISQQQLQQEVRGYYGHGQGQQPGFGQDMQMQDDWNRQGQQQQQGSGIQNRP